MKTENKEICKTCETKCYKIKKLTLKTKEACINSNKIDRRGRAIFEHDIIECEAFRDIVVIRNDVFTTERNSSKQPLEVHGLENLEVIGNIYDNSEIFEEMRKKQNEAGVWKEPNYHDIVSLSASQTKKRAKSGYEFWKSTVFNPDRKPQKDTPALVFGSLTHVLLLEPHEYSKQFVILPEFKSITVQKEKIKDLKPKKPTKKEYGENYEKEMSYFELKNEKYKKLESKIKSVSTQKANFLELHKGKKVITEKDYNKAKLMIETLREHKLANAILTGLITEKPYFMVDKKTGLRLKGKLDGIAKLSNGTIIIVDYKTANDIDKAIKYNYDNLQKYHIQGAFYEKLVRNRYPDCKKIKTIFIIQSKIDGEEDKISVCSYDEADLEFATAQVEFLIGCIKSELDRHKAGDKTVFQYCPNEVLFSIPPFYIDKQQI